MPDRLTRFANSYAWAFRFFKGALTWNMVVLGAQSPLLSSNYANLSVAAGMLGELQLAVAFAARVSTINFELAQTRLRRWVRNWPVRAPI